MIDKAITSINLQLTHDVVYKSLDSLKFMIDQLALGNLKQAYFSSLQNLGVGKISYDELINAYNSQFLVDIEKIINNLQYRLSDDSIPKDHFRNDVLQILSESVPREISNDLIDILNKITDKIGTKSSINQFKVLEISNIAQLLYVTIEKTIVLQSRSLQVKSICEFNLYNNSIGNVEYSSDSIKSRLDSFKTNIELIITEIKKLADLRSFSHYDYEKYTKGIIKTLPHLMKVLRFIHDSENLKTNQEVKLYGHDLYRQFISTYTTCLILGAHNLIIKFSDKYKNLIEKSKGKAIYFENRLINKTNIRDINQPIDNEEYTVDGVVQDLKVYRKGRLLISKIVIDIGTEQVQAIGFFSHLHHRGLFKGSSIRLQSKYEQSSKLNEGRPAYLISKININDLSKSDWIVAFHDICDRIYERWPSNMHLEFDLIPLHPIKDKEDIEIMMGGGEAIFAPLTRINKKQ